MLSSATRSTRLTAATIATLAVLAGAAVSAEAAPTCGNKLCLETTHEPDGEFVMPDGYIRYRVDLTNPGTATATKATLTFTLDPATTLVSFPQGCTRTAAGVSPTVVSCFLGSVKPTGAAPRTFRFLVKAPGSETSTSAVARVSADARQSDKQDNPNDPTGEAFSDAAEVVAIDFRQGLSASFVPADTDLTLDTDTDGTGATSTDKRTAKFILRASGFSTTATVDDEVDDTFVCPPSLKCPTGGWTEAFIPGPNGLFDAFSPPSHMQLELRYDVSTLNGAKPNNYVLLHDKDYLASTTNYEQISALCGSNPRPPCLLGRPVVLSDGDLLVKALVTGNWRYR